METRRFLTPSLFGVVVLMFFMPFMLVSCGGEVVAAVSGVDLVTGTQISTGVGARTVPAQPSVQLAMICAIAGVGFGLSKLPWRYIASAAAGAVGFFILIGVSNEGVRQVQSQGYGLTGHVGIGLQGALLFFAGATLASGYLAFNLSRSSTPAVVPAPARAPMSAAFCEECGAKAPLGSAFCERCGGRL